MQFFERDRPDTPQHSDIKWMQELQLGAGRDFKHARPRVDAFSAGARLGELGGEFGDELRGRNSDAARQTHAIAHGVAHLMGNLARDTEDALRTGDIKKGFVK